MGNNFTLLNASNIMLVSCNFKISVWSVILHVGTEGQGKWMGLLFTLAESDVPGTGPVTRQPSSKLSSHPISQTNEQMNCWCLFTNNVLVKRHQQGTPCTWGWVNFFSCFSTTHPLSFWSLFLSPGGITHFENENISYQLALRQAFVFLLATSC